MLAFDTETTGVDLWHGCLPFFFAFCNEQGRLDWVEWQVDPFTRLPIINSWELDHVVGLLGSDEIVAHHAQFDLRAMERISEQANTAYRIDWQWNAIQDSLIASHAFRNLWGHSLKNLREVLLGVDECKQAALRDAVNKARRICRSKKFKEEYGEWRIADASDPHWPAIDKAPREKVEGVEGWWMLDGWLPKAIADRAPEFLPDPASCPKTYDNVWGSKDTIEVRLNAPWEGEQLCDELSTSGAVGVSQGPTAHPWITVLRDYALEDVETTLPLWDCLSNALHEEGLYEQYLERLKLVRITYEMEETGLNVLTDTLSKEIKRYSKEAKIRGDKATVIADKLCPPEQPKKADADEIMFNIASPTQLSKLFYSEEGFNLPIVKKTKPSKSYPQGQASTDDETITKLIGIVEGKSTNHNAEASQFFKHLRFSRRNNTAANYLTGYDLWRTGNKIRVHLNITGSKFTRQSSNDPNLQNVGTGKEDEQGEIDYCLRTCFGPPPGYVWLAWDYSNIELRIWAYLTGNKEFVKAFEDDYSVHLVIARELHPSLSRLTDDEAKETKEYRKTKNGNFSILYGASERKANATYGVSGAFKKINKRFPEVRDFTQLLHRQIKIKRCIETLTGYRLFIPTDQPHVAISGKVQGTAGAIIGRAMIDCTDWLRNNAPCMKLILQVHDELIFQVPKGYYNLHAEHITTNLIRLMEQQGERLAVPIPTPVHGQLIETNWSKGTNL